MNKAQEVLSLTNGKTQTISEAATGLTIGDPNRLSFLFYPRGQWYKYAGSNFDAVVLTDVVVNKGGAFYRVEKLRGRIHIGGGYNDIPLVEFEKHVGELIQN